MDSEISSKPQLCDVCQKIDLSEMILDWEGRVKKRGPDPEASHAWEDSNMPLEDTPVYEHRKSILHVKG